jgi:hypothetical protein
MIQCLGRKRIMNKNDKITVLIKALNGKSLNGRIFRLKRKLEAADFLLDEINSLTTFLQTYPRQYTGDMIYDIADKDDKNKASKKVNEIMYHKCAVRNK